MLGVDENDELIDTIGKRSPEYGARQSFPQMILENLKAAGVQQAHKADRISFTALSPWPGYRICAEGRYLEGDAEKRAAIFIGPEFGTVLRVDLVEAAREADGADGIACWFIDTDYNEESFFVRHAYFLGANDPTAPSRRR